MQDVCVPALPQLTDKWNKYQFHLAQVLEAMHSELGNNHSDIFMLGFRNGSVFADFLFLLPKEEAMDVGDIQTRLSSVLRSKFGNKSKVQSK